MKCYNIDIMILSRDMGELDEVTCMEKAAYVVAALRSKKNEAVITLMKHLGFGHAQHTNSFGSFIEGMENLSLIHI